MALESQSAIRSKVVKEAAFQLTTALALRYQQLDVVAATAVDLLNKFEHLPTIMAELAEFAMQHTSDARLVSSRGFFATDCWPPLETWTTNAMQS